MQVSKEKFLVVGLGASAGGIKALHAFFDAMPPDSGLAFVIIMHLSPNYESNLAQVLQQRTSMPVTQVTKRIRVEPNQVYVIPPNYHLSMQDSMLCPVEPQQPPGHRVAIDLFFRTLSVACGPRAVCIVLSGTDSDGVIGIKHVKEQGGLTIAQDPLEAEYDSMPRAAIATGMVDWILPVSEMPMQLLELLRNEKRMQVPPEEVPSDESSTVENKNAGGPVTVPQVSNAADESALQHVMRFLYGQTGHDFSHYKRATILRRLARRLQVNMLENISAYLDFLRSHPAETPALLHDLLISVTNFFRDPEAFKSVENNVSQLFSNKRQSNTVRAWVAGCATGEEAYSVAILLHEFADRLPEPPSIQVFASDIDPDVIQSARSGLYPTTIEADVSQDRLKRFFQKDHGRYRIKKEVRETVLFAVHDVLHDSPFSHMDLITCRNLLIYLKREAQERVLSVFHYSLRPGGLLFLGGSENVEESHEHFAALDGRHRLFVRRAVEHAEWHVPPIPREPVLLRIPQSPVLPSLPFHAPQLSDATSDTSTFERRALLFGNLHHQLVEQYAPPSVVVNEKCDIVHLSESAGKFLQYSAGEPTANLLRIVHPSLRVDLRTSIFRATQTGAPVSARRVPMEADDKVTYVNIHVRPVLEPKTARGFILVVFESFAPVATPESMAPVEPAARHLEEEILHLKEQLSATAEQYEGSTEDLKASNEELQAMNEELRSATEELETSKEELQSINEELMTVNHELKSNVEELGRVNSDLNNLMASTEIGTIFLDKQLCIKRFTPIVQEIFNIIPTDIGRPLSDITHKMNYPTLARDADRVLKDLKRIEREVATGGMWFLTTLLPYRTADDRIDGVVLNFVDVTVRKHAELRRVALEREVAALAERERIARELHDTLAQGFTGIKLQLDAAEIAVEEEPSAISRYIVRAREIASESLKEARQSVLSLRSQPLQDQTLAVALERLAEQATNGISVKFSSTGAPVTLPPDYESDLYRIAQEGLTNALRHANGQNVEIQLNYTQDGVRLRVADDGKGFDAKARRDGMGITGMRERAARMGARLAIADRPEGGTEVTLDLDQVIRAD